MSAIFHVLYRRHYVRFTFETGKSVWELVDIERATPFVSEADGWLAAAQHHLPTEQTQVVNAQDGKVSA